MKLFLFYINGRSRRAGSVLTSHDTDQIDLSEVSLWRIPLGQTDAPASLASIPHRRVGLILGCPKRTFGGWSNPYFENRIAAAAELYYHRKIDYFVVSGDNHVHSYDEPTDMKNALIDKGVPADRVYLDYAGFRTLDSVVRAKEIFAQEKITIISQMFQNQRAIFLADHHGIDAIGFNAPEVALRHGLKTMSREQLTFPLLSGEAGTAMTSPSFCTSGHERVYITAFGCEICFGPMHGIEQFSVFRFEAATAFLNFIPGSRHVRP